MINITKEWVNVKEIIKIYGLSRPTVTNLLKKFKSMPKYKNSYTDLGYRTKKFELAAVKEFMLFMNHSHLKGE